MTDSAKQTNGGDLVVTPPKVTIGFSRKLNLGNYNQAEASAYIEVPFDVTDPNLDQVVAGMKERFSIAKAQVFDELGVEYDVDPATQQVIEGLKNGLGATVIEEKPKRAAVASPKPQGPSKPDDKDALWAALADNLRANQRDEKGNLPDFFDNRSTKTGKQPDFKVRNTNHAVTELGLRAGAGLWLDNAPQDFKDEFVTTSEEPF